MWNQKKMVQMNLFTKQKQTYRCREQTCGYQGRAGEGRDGLGVWGLVDANYYIENG